MHAKSGKVLCVAEEGASSEACPPLWEGSKCLGCCLLSQGMQIFLPSHSTAPNPTHLWEPKACFGLDLQDVGPEGKWGELSLCPAKPGQAHPTALRPHAGAAVLTPAPLFALDAIASWECADVIFLVFLQFNCIETKEIFMAANLLLLKLELLQSFKTSAKWVNNQFSN